MDMLDQLIAELHEPDPQTREQAAGALGTLAAPQAVTPLVSYLADPTRQDPPVQDSEGYAVYQYFDPQYEAFGEDALPIRVREAVVDALGEIGGPTVVEPLIDLLQNAEWNLRKKTADALGKLGDLRAVEPLIIALTSDPRVAKGAEVALGKLGDPRAVEPLLKRLPGEYAAYALGKLGDLRAVPPLMSQASTRHPTSDGWLLRTSALTALGQLGDRQALDTLMSCTQDTHQLVRRDAIIALGRMGKGDSDITTFLLDLSTNKQEDLESQRIAILALGYCGGERALQALTSFTRTKANPSLLPTTVRALELLGDPRAIPFLLPLLQNEDEHTKVYVASALGKLHAVEAVKDILPLLQARDVTTRAIAAHALGELGSPQAIAPLLRLVTDFITGQSHVYGNPDHMLLQCAIALGKLGDPGAIAPLQAALLRVHVRTITNRDLYRAITKALAQLEKGQ